jgi:hypothetical protein
MAGAMMKDIRLFVCKGETDMMSMVAYEYLECLDVYFGLVSNDRTRLPRIWIEPDACVHT